MCDMSLFKSHSEILKKELPWNNSIFSNSLKILHTDSDVEYMKSTSYCAS